MKAALYDVKGIKKQEMSLPAFFDAPVREDMVMKAVEMEKQPQPYGLYVEAGRRHSASGIISHKRHDWKGQYGRGIARTPRKIMWRRGTQFNWVGAEVSNTRGGRRPHGPKPSVNLRKMNSKEYKVAFRSALAATAQHAYLASRYARISDKQTVFPLVLESAAISLKTKQFNALIEKVLGPLASLNAIVEEVRAGRGKTRGRRYKRNAGLLLVTGSKENARVGGLTVRPLAKLSVLDLYPLGRAVLFTEHAVEEMKSL